MFSVPNIDKVSPHVDKTFSVWKLRHFLKEICSYANSECHCPRAVTLQIKIKHNSVMQRPTQSKGPRPLRERFMKSQCKFCSYKLNSDDDIICSCHNSCWHMWTFVTKVYVWCLLQVLLTLYVSLVLGPLGSRPWPIRGADLSRRHRPEDHASSSKSPSVWTLHRHAAGPHQHGNNITPWWRHQMETFSA